MDENSITNDQNQTPLDAAQALALVRQHESAALEAAFVEFFSPKQKELFLKKLKGESLSKTEREYYSRVVRKRILALANASLHLLAQQVLEK